MATVLISDPNYRLPDYCTSEIYPARGRVDLLTIFVDFPRGRASNTSEYIACDVGGATLVIGFVFLMD